MNGNRLNRQQILEEENQSLKKELDHLRAELLQRDTLIATLEAQVKALIKEGEPPKQDPKKAVTESSPRNGFPPRCPIPKDGGNRPKGREALDANDESATPPKPLSPRRPSLVPPSRRTTESSPPHADHKKSVDTPEASCKLNSVDGSDRSDRPTSLCSMDTFDETQSADASSTAGSKSSLETSDSEDRIRRVIDTTKGPIKALPRELSIFNSDDDDVTKYSNCDDLTYHLEAVEMRDAYNARGIYTGSVSRKDQLPHGMGSMKYHLQGRSYEGHWFYGHWHGLGKIINANGDVYVGLVVKDLREGRGKLYYSDGRVFEGTFEQDDPVKGTLTFPDGAKYVGELHNGCRHGYGVYYFTDGSIYQGQTVMNVFEGKGKMTWTDGGWYEGEWLRGEIHGYGMEVRADGSLRHKGQWKKGVPIRI